jgi:hypothetical protein
LNLKEKEDCGGRRLGYNKESCVETPCEIASCNTSLQASVNSQLHLKLPNFVNGAMTKRPNSLAVPQEEKSFPLSTITKWIAYAP